MFVADVARNLNCEYELKYHAKNGEIKICKIGMTTLTIPKFNNAEIKNFKVNVVICKGYSDEPLVLYTNLNESVEKVAVKVVKAYLKRWRIEELYATKKQKLNFEKFKIRSLRAIKTLNLIVTILLSFVAVCSENIGENEFSISLIAASKRTDKIHKYIAKTRFFFFSIIDGIAAVLAQSRRGISRCPNEIVLDNQLSLMLV